MKVADIMSTNIVSVEMDDSLAVVKNIFDNASFHHLLVVEVDTLMGVISDRDLLKSISPNVGTIAETTRDAATLKKRVHQVMSRKLVSLKQNASVAEAIAIFNTQGVSCIPIVGDSNRPVGIVSWRDILKTFQPA